MAAKPTVEALGIDVDAQAWQRSGDGDGSIEVAFVRDTAGSGGDWVLMRVAATRPAGCLSMTGTSGCASSMACGKASSTTRPASRAGVTLADAAPGGQQRASCLRLPAMAGGLAVKPACELVIVLCATVIIKFVNHNFSSDMLEAMPCQEGDRG